MSAASCSMVTSGYQRSSGEMSGARGAHPVRFPPGRFDAEEAHRIAGVLEIDDAQRTPFDAGTFHAHVLVHEAHDGFVAVLRQPLRRIRPAVARDDVPDAAAEWRS